MMASRLAVCVVAAALAGCASAPPPPPAPAAAPAPSLSAPPVPALQAPTDASRYRCDHDIEFTVRFGDGTAEIDAGAQGKDSLERDAGGVTPQQTVYSSTRLKAEFGLGADGREAMLHYTSPPLEAHCTRD